MNTSLPYTVALLTLVGSLNAFSGEYRKQTSHEFDLPGLQKVVVESDSGDIRIYRSDSPMAKAVVTMEADAGSQDKADRIFANNQIEFLQPNSNTARVELKNQRSGWDWVMFWKKYPDVELELYIPDGVNLDIATGSGDVDGKNFAADIKLATGAGDVEFTEVRGSLRIATGSGDVELKRFEGKISAATGAGDFEADGSFSEFSVSTGAGDVQILADNPVSANSSVSTGAGDIQISLPVGSSFNLAADVGFGDISCQFDIVDTDPNKKSFRGVYNEGSVNIRLSTGFGDVFVARR